MARLRFFPCFLSLTLTLLLLTSFFPVSIKAEEKASTSIGKQSLRHRHHSMIKITPQHQRDLRIIRQRAFARNHDLLMREKVPFDPEDLLEPDWRERLAPHFNAMPQMHENKHIRSGRLNGVYFAHTLFLPEKMNASGNLVIVAKRVVYGGPNVEIIAPGRDVSIS